MRSNIDSVFKRIFNKIILNIFPNNPDEANVLSDFGPLYHSYRLFGVQNQQLPGIFQLNQTCKEPIILSYILFALAKCRSKSDTKVTFAELFCADGYYAMIARHLGVSSSIGIDNNRDSHFATAERIAKRLGINDCTFIEMEVNDIDTIDAVDIVANIGGLYHVENPETILDKSYTLTRKWLIIQTVVSLANESDDYFEIPAPGWTWGNRYSRLSFERSIARRGWNVVDSHFNFLEGNDRLEDRGSIYMLIKKDK